MSSIRISQLNNLSPITADDFIPIVDSGSLTTYHTPISIINTYWSVYGSSSFATRTSSSLFASSSTIATTSTFATSSLSSSYASASTSASYALNATFAVSATSASYASASTSASYALTSSWALNAIYATNAISSGFASASISSSYSVTASTSLRLAASSGSIPWYHEKGLRLNFPSAVNDTGLDTGSVRVRAEALILKDNNNNWVCLNDIDETAYRTAALPRTIGGWLEPDTSVQFKAGIWYDVWALYNPTTGDYGVAFGPSGSSTNNNPRVSTSSIDSVLPAGYTYKRMVASVRTLAVEDPRIVFGRWVEYSQPNRHHYRYSASYLGSGIGNVLHYLPNEVTTPYRCEMNFLRVVGWLNTGGDATFTTGDQVSSKQVYWKNTLTDTYTTPAYSVIFHDDANYEMIAKPIDGVNTKLKVINNVGAEGTFVDTAWVMHLIIYSE